jgi:hypothetical protein
MIERSKEFGAIAKAFLKAQPNIETALKTKEGHYGKYADLVEVMEVIKKPLNAEGILIIQAIDISRTENGDDKVIIITSLIHAETSQFFSSNTPVFCKQLNDPTALGSGITYSKRFGLQAIGVIPSDDDDGKAAAREAAKIEKPTEDQQLIIDEICKKMPAKEGFTPDNKSIGRLCYINSVSVPKDYPNDITKIVGIIEWLLGKFKDTQLYKNVI